MSNKNANIGARLDRLPNSGWHIKMWLVSAFALLVCWSNGIALVIVSTGVSMNMNWRIQYIIPSVLSIIASIIIYNKYPESPRWLESQGRVEAKAVKNLPYSALFKGKLLKRTICGSLVLIGMNTIQYTLMNWMPSLLSSLGYDTSQSQFMTMFGLFGAPFGIFLASLYMDKVPRKATGVILLIAMAVMGIITSKQTTMTALISVVAVIIAVSIVVFGVETRGESVEDIGNVE